MLVLGGNGFIGRHAVDALLDRGASVIIGTRDPRQPSPHLSPAALRCPRRAVRLERHVDAGSWATVLAGVDAVVNCVGILRQRRGERYADVHDRAPVSLARACKSRGLRFVHVSALGLAAPVVSRFLISKRDGERGIARVGGDWVIVKPSLVDGANGYGAHWVRKVANWPVQFVPASANGKIAAIDARDLGEALAHLALSNPPAVAGVVELGGNDTWTMAGYLRAMRTRGSEPLQIRIPGWLARAVSHACDVLHLTPFSFGHFELLKRDNAPVRNRFYDILGRAPRPVGRRPSASTRPIEDWARVCR